MTVDQKELIPSMARKRTWAPHPAGTALLDAVRGPSNHVLGFEIIEVASGETQPLGIDRLVVLAEQR
jgi:hypothetical protein